MEHILFCEKCKVFTTRKECLCGGSPVTTRPPKYATGDKYGDYRRKVKLIVLQEKGLL